MMMEEQVEKVRAETKAVRESVGRARGVLEGLGREEGVGGLDAGRRHGALEEERKWRRKQDSDRRVWEVLEREVGGI